MTISHTQKQQKFQFAYERGLLMIEELNKVKKIMVQKKDNLFYLKQRWIDERKYEDFNDYRKIILEIFKDFPNTKVDKNFNITITGKERIMIIKVGVSKIKLESLQREVSNEEKTKRKDNHARLSWSMQN